MTQPQPAQADNQETRAPITVHVNSFFSAVDICNKLIKAGIPIKGMNASSGAPIVLHGTLRCREDLFSFEKFYTWTPDASRLPEGEPEEKYHSYSTEALYHFQCGSCQQWFTIGDCPEKVLFKATCPSCGHQAAAARRDK